MCSQLTAENHPCALLLRQSAFPGWSPFGLLSLMLGFLTLAESNDSSVHQLCVTL